MFRRLCDLTDQSDIVHAVLAVNLLKSFLGQRDATVFLLNLKTKLKKIIEENHNYITFSVEKSTF